MVLVSGVQRNDSVLQIPMLCAFYCDWRWDRTKRKQVFSCGPCGSKDSSVTLGTHWTPAW